jgi:hypothetical protein
MLCSYLHGCLCGYLMDPQPPCVVEPTDPALSGLEV